MAAPADWSSSLPDDLIRRLAHRLLAADDLDCYMVFRAVCRSWRSVTADPRADGTDPRFHPRNWAMLSKSDDGPNGDVVVVSFVNLRTGRFLCKSVPMPSNYFLVAATDGGLLVLAELAAGPAGSQHGVRVVNPFTRSVVARFSVPILGYDISKVAVVTPSSPTMTMMLFISGVRNNFVGWADLNSTGFNAFWVEYPDDLLSSMTPFAGDVYMTNRHGSIISSSSSSTAADVAAGHQERSAGAITMTTAIPAAAPSVVECIIDSYYLVESEGELLLVSFRCTAAAAAGGGLVVDVHKVDTVRKLLQPVESIGSRAIFVSRIRSISVDASVFPTIQAGCIYFVESTLTYNDNQHATVISSRRLGYQRHEAVVEWGERTRRQFGPCTLVQVLGDYCMFTPVCEPDMMLA